MIFPKHIPISAKGFFYEAEGISVCVHPVPYSIMQAFVESEAADGFGRLSMRGCREQGMPVSMLANSLEHHDGWGFADNKNLVGHVWFRADAKERIVAHILGCILGALVFEVIEGKSEVHEEEKIPDNEGADAFGWIAQQAYIWTKQIKEVRRR